MTGIYKIQSKCKPNRCYIGSAINIQQRWRAHKSDLNLLKHHSIKLQRHFNKYTLNDLEFIVIEECDKIKLIEKEQYFINNIKPYFNCSPTAGSCLGYKHSKEFILKQKNRKLSLETRKKISDARKSQIFTNESNIKRSLNLKGRIPWNKGLNKEININVLKQSNSQKGRIPWNKGLKNPYSKDTLEKMKRK